MSVDYQIESPETLVDTSRCRLYVEVAPDYVLLAVLDSDSKQFVGLQYINLEKLNTFQHLKETLNGNKWLTDGYAQVCIVYNFPETLIVPTNGFEKDKATSYLDLVFGDIMKGAVLQESIADWDAVNIYRVPTSLHQVLQSHFPGATFSHSHAAFLKKLKNNYLLQDADTAFITFYERKLMLACFKNGALQLLKNFEYETAEDVNYHLLNTFNQLQMDCESTQVYVSGLVDTQSSVYTGLQKYFLKLNYEERPAAFTYSNSFDAYPPHFFTSLFGVALCE